MCWPLSTASADVIYTSSEKGSGTPNSVKVASVTRAQVQEIAETKMPDLNAANIESAMRMIEGTARSMGFTVTD